jgi:hypothetical protein
MNTAYGEAEWVQTTASTRRVSNFSQELLGCVSGMAQAEEIARRFVRSE